MQFAVSVAAGCRVCVGDTWGAYGIDGNGDGTRNVYDPHDAIPGAANYTKHNGAPAEWQRALRRYNDSHEYYLEVMHWASVYRSAIAASSAISGATAQQLVTHPNITFQSSCQKTDILTGQIDPRVNPTDGRTWSWSAPDHCDHWHLAYSASRPAHHTPTASDLFIEIHHGRKQTDSPARPD